MKRLFILFAVALSATACTSKPDKTGSETTDSLVEQTPATTPVESSTQTMCFLKTTGTANQDSTKLKLVINGDLVTGDFAHYPYEKDRRVGTLAATRSGNLISGQWFFMQEGMNDTLQVEFKLDGDKLVQKNYTVDPKTGREVFSEASVFNIEFNKVDCRD